MTARIEGKMVAILATHGFEQAELLEPLKALRAAGATVDVVSPTPGRIIGFHNLERGEGVPVDRALDEADPADYDALVLPGGPCNPERLRADPRALAFVRAFVAAGKPIGATCHGPEVLIGADVLRGRTVTGIPPIRKDLAGAGACVLDRPVVCDHGLVTGRTPKDLPAFCARLVEEIAEGHSAGVVPDCRDSRAGQGSA